MTRRARFAVPGDPSAVAFARDRVITQIRAWGVRLGEGQQDAVRLVTSELITNAVVHAGGFITVGLHLSEGRLLLVVYDGNPEPPKRLTTTEDDEGGRGLALVGLLAARHGWEPTRHGKRVWAEFAVPAPNPAAPGGVPRGHGRERAPAPGVSVRAVVPEGFAEAPGP
ncbi:ATP-binding protein [Streptomyces sp. F63]|uniref:ATP-binding protein n=1 Tax=Streptomyces sp. F63 TaxID=2824887 RepID=UPI001B39CC47|nr:ATP-binding protein [Streptomyces sp. F63]MBQ0986549.1 ATP-binding protein [Streptomyces sp. F63]